MRFKSFKQVSQSRIIYLILLLLFKSIESCIEKPIEQNIRNADVILSGSVLNINTKVDMSDTDQTYSASIRVNSVIKGHSILNEIITLSKSANMLMKSYIHDVSTQQHSLVDHHLTTNRLLTLNGNILHVNNFGSTRICDSQVKLNDIRVFLLSVDQMRNLYLNSSLIHPTVERFKNSNIFAKNVNFDVIKCKNFNLKFHFYFFFLFFISLKCSFILNLTVKMLNALKWQQTCAIMAVFVWLT